MGDIPASAYNAGGFIVPSAFLTSLPLRVAQLSFHICPPILGTKVDKPCCSVCVNFLSFETKQKFSILILAFLSFSCCSFELMVCGFSHIVPSFWRKE